MNPQEMRTVMGGTGYGEEEEPEPTDPSYYGYYGNEGGGEGPGDVWVNPDGTTTDECPIELAPIEITVYGSASVDLVVEGETSGATITFWTDNSGRRHIHFDMSAAVDAAVDALSDLSTWIFGGGGALGGALEYGPGGAWGGAAGAVGSATAGAYLDNLWDQYWDAYNADPYQ